jgi:acyl-CoA hydrolase
VGCSNTAVGRQSVSGRTDFVSMPFSRRFKREDERGGGSTTSTSMVSVSPPDRFGFCSFGTSMLNKLSYCRRARTVLAEVFPGYPRTGGTNQIHVSEIDAFVDGGDIIPPRAGARELQLSKPIAASSTTW